MRKKFLFVAVAVILAIMAAVYIYLSGGTAYVAKVGRITITPAEFYVYLYEQKLRFEEKGELDIWEMDFDENNSAESVAKHNALENNIMIKVATLQANILGITLTAEEQAEVTQWAESAFMQLGEERIANTGITREILQQIYEENLLYSKTFYETTKNFVLNENDFNNFFEQYRKDNRKNFTTVLIHYMLIEDEGQAQQALARLIEGSEFTETAAKFSSESSTKPIDARDSQFDTAVTDMAYNMLQGESELVLTAKGYYIIQAMEIDMPDRDDIRDEAEASYTLIKKNELFQQEYAKWAQEAKVVQDSNLLDTISIDILN